ncbi:MAG: hypothetical protein WCF06_05440 [Nitrososphaeraceae archaeon]
MISIIVVATILYAASSIISSVIKKEPWIWFDLAMFFFISGVTIYFLANFPPDITVWLVPVIVAGLGYGLTVRVLKSKITRERPNEITKHQDDQDALRSIR